MNHSADKKRMFKNTILLYLRMGFIMFISLYTSRVVLDKLGVEDFGIYNIVGSIVVSFAFLRYAMMEATQRFYSYRIGIGNDNCSKEFTASMNIHIMFILLFLIVFETFGLWFLHSVLQIPPERREAAEIVYQITILTFIFNFIRVPHNALITASEKMSAYAYLSVVEALLKLFVIYIIIISPYDKLIVYSLLLFFTTIIINIFYILYCVKYLRNDCRYSLSFDKELLREMLSFTSWNFIGGIASTASHDAPNYFINVYLGVRVNAAMGIAKQVNGAVYGFFSSFQTAFNPQIVKAYADNDKDYLFQLINKTSKLSFLLIYVISLPLIICINDVLNIWLTIVPDYSTIFCVCILISQLVFALSSPLQMVALAVGNIKKYQLIVGIISLLIIPASWLILLFGYKPYFILIFQIIINILLLIYRAEYASEKINYPRKDYYWDVAAKSLLIIPLLTAPIIFLIGFYFCGLSKIVIVTLSSFLIIIPLYLFICFNRKERNLIINLVLRRIKK